ncbi:hypothetical protein VTN02DRAFT_3292 [Thermoascus thermophilus]
MAAGTPIESQFPSRAQKFPGPVDPRVCVCVCFSPTRSIHHQTRPPGKEDEGWGRSSSPYATLSVLLDAQAKRRRGSPGPKAQVHGPASRTAEQKTKNQKPETNRQKTKSTLLEAGGVGTAPSWSMLRRPVGCDAIRLSPGDRGREKGERRWIVPCPASSRVLDVCPAACLITYVYPLAMLFHLTLSWPPPYFFCFLPSDVGSSEITLPSSLLGSLVWTCPPRDIFRRDMWTASGFLL